jgi:UDP:flavonoid glycosyltransferase YjiC (YdhE family)
MDQFFWGRRVRDLGIGPVPPSCRRLSQRTLTSALGEALGSSAMAEKARALSAQLEGRDGAVELAGVLHDDLS